MQGPFSVWNEGKRGLRELRLKPAQRHLFLYEKVLLFTKRAGKDTDRATYHFKNALKVWSSKFFDFVLLNLPFYEDLCFVTYRKLNFK